MTVQSRDGSIPIIAGWHLLAQAEGEKNFMKEIRLTPEDLAERWKVPTTTLSQWRWNGKGPQFIRLGKHIVYRLQDVELFEEQKLRRDTTHTGYVLASKEETRTERRR